MTTFILGLLLGLSAIGLAISCVALIHGFRVRAEIRRLSLSAPADKAQAPGGRARPPGAAKSKLTASSDEQTRQETEAPPAVRKPT
ncbi:hypothetical protein TMEC54S_00722 [Thauera mechernichensis]